MSHPLTYDTLPPHSRLRREYVDGILKITALPEEPGPLVRRAALIGTALPAAILCSIILVIALGIIDTMYQLNQPYIPPWLSLVLAGAILVFCGALFALIWRVDYSARMQGIERGLQQTTILAASEERLLIETTGPLGEASHDLKEIAAIRIGRMGSRRALGMLEILLADGSRIDVLPGRDDVELKWVARALASAIQKLTIP